MPYKTKRLSLYVMVAFLYNPKKPDGITPSGNQVTRQELSFKIQQISNF